MMPLRRDEDRAVKAGSSPSAGRSARILCRPRPVAISDMSRGWSPCEGVDLHVRETAVQIVLETRGREHAQQVLDAVAVDGQVARSLD